MKARRRRKFDYALGTWVAVPLAPGGYGVGIIARCNGKAGAFGYFFGPRRESVPSLEEVRRLAPADAVLLAQFSTLGLAVGAWSIIGVDPSFSRERWPMPGFWHRDDISGEITLRYYGEEKLEFIREVPSDPSATVTFPEDGDYGYGALEVELDKCLTKVEKERGMPAVRKINYNLGTWFAVPLYKSGYGVGVVARASSEGKVLGYFFGPKREAIPVFQEVSDLKPEQAVLIARFSDLGLLRRKWPILGDDPNWHKGEWPMPPFIHYDDKSQKAWLRCYDEATLEQVVKEEPCDPALVSVFHKDDYYGSMSLEIMLEQKLAPPTRRRRKPS